ncbi:hypothetical protein AAG906_025981 [Vitis piasezkii]
MSDAEDGSDEGSESEDEETPKKKLSLVIDARPMDNYGFMSVSDNFYATLSDMCFFPNGKKGGAHTATPHPNKKAGKTPATGDKSKASPKLWPSLLQILQEVHHPNSQRTFNSKMRFNPIPRLSMVSLRAKEVCLSKSENELIIMHQVFQFCHNSEGEERRGEEKALA